LREGKKLWRPKFDFNLVARVDGKARLRYFSAIFLVSWNLPLTMIRRRGRVKSFGPKPFKNFGFGFDHENFLIWVDEGWQTCVKGSSMFCSYAKLKSRNTWLNPRDKIILNFINWGK
jgi:hypothetical protein